MSAKSRLRSLLPEASVLKRDGYQRFPSRHEAARRAATYERPDVVAGVIGRTHSFTKLLAQGPVRPSLESVQTQTVLAMTSNGPIEVVDLGGAAGAAFLEINALAPGLIHRWHVVETPEMVRQAAAAIKHESLAFFSDIGSAIGDMARPVLIAQGSLQYVEDPFETLKAVIEAGPRFLYFSRTPLLTQGEEAVFLTQTSKLTDHGPQSGRPANGSPAEITVPLTLISRRELLEYLSSHFELVTEFPDGGPGPIGKFEVTWNGFLFRAA